MYHAYSSRNCLPGIIELDFFAIKNDLPSIRWLHAIQNLHQGGFTRPVLSHDGVDLSFPECQADIIQRHQVGRKDLENAIHFDDIAQRYLPFSRLGCRISRHPRLSHLLLWNVNFDFHFATDDLLANFVDFVNNVLWDNTAVIIEDHINTAGR
jgi:hypothetical protein